MNTRRLTPADLPSLLGFERQYMEDFEPESLLAWTRAIDRNVELWISCLPTSVAFTAADGSVAGLALWRVDRGVATLITIHVRADHRRAGLGGQLVDAFLRSAEAAGAVKASLGVHRENHGAERLYIEHGFRPARTEGSYLVMEREPSATSISAP